MALERSFYIVGALVVLAVGIPKGGFGGAWDKKQRSILLPGAILDTLLGALTFTLTSSDVIRLLAGLMSLGFLAT